MAIPGETYRHADLDTITILSRSSPEPASPEPASLLTLRLSVHTKFHDVTKEFKVIKDYGPGGVPARTREHRFPLADLAPKSPPDRLLFETLSVLNFGDVARYFLDYAIHHRTLHIEARVDVVQSMCCVDREDEAMSHHDHDHDHEIEEEEEEEMMTCPVWLDEIFGDEYFLRTQCCGHFYHGKCILSWFEQSGTCPMCRGLVYPYRHE